MLRRAAAATLCTVELDVEWTAVRVVLVNDYEDQVCALDFSRRMWPIRRYATLLCVRGCQICVSASASIIRLQLMHGMSHVNPNLLKWLIRGSPQRRCRGITIVQSTS